MSCSSINVSMCVHTKTLTQYLAEYLTCFHQTYINYALLWDRDECDKFWIQKVAVQGHSGITYAGTVTVQAEAHLVSS